MTMGDGGARVVGEAGIEDEEVWKYPDSTDAGLFPDTMEETGEYPDSIGSDDTEAVGEYEAAVVASISGDDGMEVFGVVQREFDGGVTAVDAHKSVRDLSALNGGCEEKMDGEDGCDEGGECSSMMNCLESSEKSWLMWPMVSLASSLVACSLYIMLMAMCKHDKVMVMMPGHDADRE